MKRIIWVNFEQSAGFTHKQLVAFIWWYCRLWRRGHVRSLTKGQNLVMSCRLRQRWDFYNVPCGLEKREQHYEYGGGLVLLAPRLTAAGGMQGDTWHGAQAEGTCATLFIAFSLQRPRALLPLAEVYWHGCHVLWSKRASAELNVR